MISDLIWLISLTNYLLIWEELFFTTSASSIDTAGLVSDNVDEYCLLFSEIDGEIYYYAQNASNFYHLLQFSTSPFVLPIPLASEMLQGMGQSLLTGVHILPSSLFL